MLKLTLLVLILIPSNLNSAFVDFYVEKWPTKIMQAGSFEYWIDKPGGEIRLVEK